MIQKLKQIIALLALCSLIILSGCTQEKEFVNEHNHRNIDFKEKSFKEALNLPLFNDALKKVAKQKGAFRSEDAARTALEEQYGFSIVADAPIRIITDENGTVFYTILIEREVKEELVFENLMMKVENNETTAAIFKYLMEGKGTISETGEYFFPNVESSEFTDLNVEGRVFYNSDTGEACITTSQVMCNATWASEPYNHIANLGCYQYAASHGFSNLYESSSTVCFGSGGGGGGGTPDGSSNNTGGLGGSGGNNQPIDLSPIGCRSSNCIEMNDLPCDELKNKINDSLFKAKLDILNTPARFALNHETGFAKVISIGGLDEFHPLWSLPNTHQLTIPDYLSEIYYMHVHNDDYYDPVLNDDIYTVKFPSYTDIKHVAIDLQQNAFDNNVPYTETGGMTITSQGIYAIYLLEPAPPSGLGATSLNWAIATDWVSFKKDYDRAALKLITDCHFDPIIYKITPQKLEKVMMKLLKKHNLYDKIGVYKASNSIPSKWGRITLNSTNKVVIVPCPE